MSAIDVLARQLGFFTLRTTAIIAVHNTYAVLMTLNHPNRGSINAKTYLI
jgi:hypothetical protein